MDESKPSRVKVTRWRTIVLVNNREEFIWLKGEKPPLDNLMIDERLVEHGVFVPQEVKDTI